MNPDPDSSPNLPQEELIRRLAEAEPDSRTVPSSPEEPDSTVKQIGEELETLADAVRNSPPENPYELEAECRRVSELVREIGQEPSFVVKTPVGLESNPAAPSPAADLGELGQYQLLAKLGEGGMGAVYKALHTRLDKLVALKVLPNDRLEDAAAVARFDREMRAVGKLEHPNIVRAMDAGDVDGKHYLVMEIVDGEDVGALVRERGPLPIPEACEIIRQAALGLQHAHDHGLVHRDIKPSNLMVTRPPEWPGTATHSHSSHLSTPQVKILDMGLALLEEAHIDADELTSTGQIMGTLDYMAPEQGSDTHNVDIRADIYSLGATLYRMLTGRAPFDTPELRSPIKKLMALATAEPSPIRDIRPDVLEPLANLVHRMLAKSPDSRPTPPAAVADELTPFAHGADLARLFDETERAQLVIGSDPSVGTNLTVDATARTADISAVSTVDAPTIVTPEAENASAATIDSVAPPAGGGLATAVSSRSTGLRWLTTLAGLAAIAALAVVIVVTTNKGDVQIEVDESIQDQIAVRLLRDGVLDRTVEIQPGTSETAHKVYAGNIQVELPAEFQDRFAVNAVSESTELIRGGKVVFRLQPRATVAATRTTRQSIAESAAETVALVFNGRSDYVEVPTLTLTDAQPITIEAWLTCRRPREASNPLAIYGPHQMVLYQTGGDWGVAKKNGDESILWRASGSLTPGERTHLAGVWDGTELTLYINGERAPAVRQGYQLGDAPGGLFIGGTPPDKLPSGEEDRWFDGEIEQVRITRGPRYRDEFTPQPRLIAENETFAAYAINENAGQRLVDISGHGHEGKIVRATWVRLDTELLLDSAPLSPEAENLGPLVNSDHREGGPSLSADGLTLIFQSNRPGGQGDNDLWYCTRPSEEDPWSEPQNLGPNVNSAASEENPSLSSDGFQLFFDSDRPNGYGDRDIWFCRRPRVNGDWSPAENVGDRVNSPGYDGALCLSADGRTMMFTSEPETFGGLADQWVCTRPSPNHPWGPRRQLEGPLNSPAFDGFATLSSDGLTVLFNSNRNGGNWPGPVWKSTRPSPDAEWSEPVQLFLENPLAVSSPELSSDGRTLLFDSKRPGGQGNNDLWLVRLPERLSGSEEADSRDGGWINLLTQIDPGRDAIDGEWTRAGAAIEVSVDPTDVRRPDRPYPRLAVVVEPRSDYEIEMDFTRTSGEDSISLILPAADRFCVLSIGSFEQFSGLQRIDGHGLFQDENPTRVKIEPVTGTRHRLRVQVRTHDAQARIRAWLDDAPFVDWEGAVESLDGHESWQARRPSQIAVGALANYRIHSLRSRVLSGELQSAARDAQSNAGNGSYALEFDGQQSHVLLPITHTEGSPLTIEATVRVDESHHQQRLGQAIVANNHRGGLSLDIERGRFNFLMQTRSNDRQDGYRRANSTDLPAAGATARIAAVFDRREMRLYVDGKQVAMTKLDGEYIPVEQPLFIGASWNGDAGGIDYPFRGLIDEVRISNTVRYTKDYQPMAHLQADDQTLGLYHFDEGVGDVLHDASGRGNDGKIVGATWVSHEEPAQPPEKAAALRFEGENQYVQAKVKPHAAWPLTIEAWVRAETAPPLGEEDGYVWRLARNLDFKLETERLEGTVAPYWECVVQQEQGDALLQPVQQVELGRWMHVAVVYTGDRMRFFQDGLPLGEVETDGKLQYPNDHRLQLGGRDGHNALGGAMRGLRVSTVARYDGPFEPTIRFDPDAHTLVLYRFDEESGDVLHDASGNGHDGQIVGATWVSAQIANDREVAE